MVVLFRFSIDHIVKNLFYFHFVKIKKRVFFFFPQKVDRPVFILNTLFSLLFKDEKSIGHHRLIKQEEKKIK